jgi:protein-tyrosine kinase
LQLVPVTGTGAVPGTSLVTDRGAAHPETISRMAKNEVRLLNAADLVQRGVIQPQQGEDPAVQVFRDLRTKIIQQSQGHNAVILVTSVSKGSGSSFVARNLAAAFALDMRKTALLVDCNLKNPSVHKLLTNPSAPGLVEYFENPNLDMKEMIHAVGIARLRVITAGKRREFLEEHFTSEKMRHLMDSLRRRYQERFIILDGPPMSKLADIRVLSDLADCVLLVARYARSTNAQIAGCLEAIGEKKRLGVVFNEEPRFPLR